MVRRNGFYTCDSDINYNNLYLVLPGVQMTELVNIAKKQLRFWVFVFNTMASRLFWRDKIVLPANDVDLIRLSVIWDFDILFYVYTSYLPWSFLRNTTILMTANLCFNGPCCNLVNFEMELSNALQIRNLLVESFVRGKFKTHLTLKYSDSLINTSSKVQIVIKS